MEQPVIQTDAAEQTSTEKSADRSPIQKDAEIEIINVRGLAGTRHGIGKVIEVRGNGEVTYRCNFNKGFHSAKLENVVPAGTAPKITDRKCAHCTKRESEHNEETDHEFEAAADQPKPEGKRMRKTAKKPRKPRESKTPRPKPERKIKEHNPRPKAPTDYSGFAKKQKCKGCGQTRQIEAFRIAHGKPLTKCRDCEREDARKRAAKK